MHIAVLSQGLLSRIVDKDLDIVCIGDLDVGRQRRLYSSIQRVLI